MMGTLKFNYDEKYDVLEIEGIKYSGDLFRSYGGLEATPEDKYLRIVKREDGLITLFQGTSKEKSQDALIKILAYGLVEYGAHESWCNDDLCDCGFAEIQRIALLHESKKSASEEVGL